jgi:hypothetical protein
MKSDAPFAPRDISFGESNCLRERHCLLACRLPCRVIDFRDLARPAQARNHCAWI